MQNLILTGAVACLAASSAIADTAYGFDAITDNDAVNTAIGEAQFSVEVKDAGNLVELLFRNAGPEAYDIVSVYWEDETEVIDEIVAIDSTTPDDVSFDIDNTPANGDFGVFASVTDPNMLGSVGPDEDLSVFLRTGERYDAILERIQNGALMLGVDGASANANGELSETESFLLDGHAGLSDIRVAPTPTAGFAGLALMGLIASRRRRRG
jgi:MYXO-CTERM domain-containing protein